MLVAMLLSSSIASAQDPGSDRPATESSPTEDTTKVVDGGAYLDVAYALSNNRPANLSQPLEGEEQLGVFPAVGGG